MLGLLHLLPRRNLPLSISCDASKRMNEPVTTETFHCDAPVEEGGYKRAQVFVGTNTMVNDVCDVKSYNQFFNSLEDNIWLRGAMDELITDSAYSEIRTRVKDILRSLFIDDWQSEAYNQHQNFAERRCQTIKRHTNTLLDRTYAPPFT